MTAAQDTAAWAWVLAVSVIGAGIVCAATLGWAVWMQLAAWWKSRGQLPLERFTENMQTLGDSEEVVGHCVECGRPIFHDDDDHAVGGYMHCAEHCPACLDLNA